MHKYKQDTEDEAKYVKEFKTLPVVYEIQPGFHLSNQVIGVGKELVVYCTNSRQLTMSFFLFSFGTRVGVYAPGWPPLLAHAVQRVNYSVGLTALQLAFFMGYEF